MPVTSHCSVIVGIMKHGAYPSHRWYMKHSTHGHTPEFSVQVMNGVTGAKLVSCVEQGGGGRRVIPGTGPRTGTGGQGVDNWRLRVMWYNRMDDRIRIRRFSTNDRAQENNIKKERNISDGVDEERKLLLAVYELSLTVPSCLLFSTTCVIFKGIGEIL